MSKHLDSYLAQISVALFRGQLDIEGAVRVDARLAKPPHRYFIVHAQGDSMNRAGISPGDLVLVRSTAAAESGDRVVALVDGESTIKVLNVREDVVALEPRSTNPVHRTTYATSELAIQGVVVASLPPTPSNSDRHE